MRTRIECTGAVLVPLAPEQAFPLLTPEGERAWVEGWAPTYPEGGRPELARGLVFEVGKDDGVSTWVVANADTTARTATYVYVLPDHRAVVVDVAVDPHPGGSRARITYHMTALRPEADDFVRAFAEGFGAFMNGWEEAIRRHLLA